MKLTRFDDLGDVRVEDLSMALPPRRVTTQELFEGQPQLAAQMERLTGIFARHYAPNDWATSDLAVRAAEPLLPGGPFDRVLLATMSPDYPSPATAPLVQERLGLPPCPSMDLSAACAGFVYGLDLAARTVLTGDRSVLLVAAEMRSPLMPAAAPGVKCLFGDGAVAARIGANRRGLRLLSTFVGADGRGHGDVRIEAGGTRHPITNEHLAKGLHSVRVADGPSVFYTAVDGFVELVQAFQDALPFDLASVDLVVPHQANGRILERVARLARIPRERMVVTVDRWGNTGGASVGLALSEALRTQRLCPGGRVLLLTAGAGHTAGAALLEWPRGERGPSVFGGPYGGDDPSVGETGALPGLGRAS